MRMKNQLKYDRQIFRMLKMAIIVLIINQDFYSTLLLADQPNGTLQYTPPQKKKEKKKKEKKKDETKNLSTSLEGLWTRLYLLTC